MRILKIEAALVLFGLLPSMAIAQTPHPLPELKPSTEQSLRLQVKQKDAAIARQQVQIAQQQGQIAELQYVKAQADFQAALAALNAEANKVKSENKWPPETGFNTGTLTFIEPPPPPPAAAPAKPDSPQPPATSK